MRVQDKCKNGLGPNHNVVDKEFGNSQTHQSVNWYLIQVIVDLDGSVVSLNFSTESMYLYGYGSFLNRRSSASHTVFVFVVSIRVTLSYFFQPRIPTRKET
jgi:hypothetical protein